MTAPLDVAGDLSATQPDGAVAGVPKAIEGRSLNQIAWMRLKRDKVAMASGAVLILIFVFAIVAPLINKWVGVDPYTNDVGILNFNTGIGTPVGHFGDISLAHPFGVEPINGRDLLARIDVGSRYSLIIALSATVLSVVLGTFFGAIAGLFRRHVDTVSAGSWTCCSPSRS